MPTPPVRGPPLDVPEGHLIDALRDTVAVAGDQPAFRVANAAGGHDTWSWRDVHDRALTLAAHLLVDGTGPGARVAILSDVRADWKIADWAIQAVGGVTVPIYPTLPPDQVAHLLLDADVHTVFVEDQAQADKIVAIADRLPADLTLIAFTDIDIQERRGTWRVHDYDTLLGTEPADDARESVEARLVALTPDDLALIIYTSGTTGVPKGAELTHRNIVASATSSVQGLGMTRQSNMTAVAFLPLAHVAGYLTIIVGTLVNGVITFSHPTRIAADLEAVQPTLIGSVPRIYERMVQRIKQAVAEAPALRRALFERSERVAMAYGAALENQGRPGAWLRFRHGFYDALVYRKLRARIGFSNLEIGLTGAAAVRPDLLRFLQGIGANVVEAYGLTETSAIVVGNRPGVFVAGSVGTPFPGAAVRLDDDQEILLQGPHVFRGYHNRPEDTSEVFVDIDGEIWFRTGDIGELDETGRLRIVDRKKEIEVLDTGKKIAPIVVEETLKSASPFVAESCIIGTGHKFAGALIQPDFDRLVHWARSEARLDFDSASVVVKPDPAGNPMTYAVGEDLLARPEVHTLFEEAIQACNARLAPHEHIKAFRLVPHAFTLDRDELTPTFKKKRRNILKNHAERVTAMFS